MLKKSTDEPIEQFERPGNALLDAVRQYRKDYPIEPKSPRQRQDLKALRMAEIAEHDRKYSKKKNG